MRVIAIIQARMSSVRLPGKVMKPLAGIPMLQHIYLRALECKNIDKVYVATSIQESDDKISQFCINQKIPFYRGSLENVLERFIRIIKKENATYVVRITGDCPLIYPNLIEKQIKVVKETKCDGIVLYPNSSIFCGQGIHSSESLKNIFQNSKSKLDLEHVGSYYLNNFPEKFKWVKILMPNKFNQVDFRLTIDEIEDYKLISTLYEELWNGEPINFHDALNWLKNNKETSRLNLKISDSKDNNLIKNMVQNNKKEYLKVFNFDEIKND